MSIVKVTFIHDWQPFGVAETQDGKKCHIGKNAIDRMADLARNPEILNLFFAVDLIDNPIEEKRESTPFSVGVVRGKTDGYETKPIAPANLDPIQLAIRDILQAAVESLQTSNNDIAMDLMAKGLVVGTKPFNNAMVQATKEDREIAVARARKYLARVLNSNKFRDLIRDEIKLLDHHGNQADSGNGNGHETADEEAVAGSLELLGDQTADPAAEPADQVAAVA